MTDATLAVHGLTHDFGDRRALDGVTFEVRPGRLTGFVGANGAGKTTTMRAIVGVMRPDAGDVTFGGAAMTLEVRRRIGYMPEERGLYPKMKVAEQLVYLARVLGVGKAEAVARAEALLDALDLTERRDDLLHTLSLGNQQRVQVAAALIHEPDLLILDEPFSGLDPIAMDAMAARLRERAEAGVPVLFSSHQLDLVERLCDDLVLIHQGRVVASGDARALREQRAGRRYRVEVGGIDAWRPALAGMTVVGSGPQGTLVDLDGSADPQALLAAAQAAGPVEHFSRTVPSLTELFAEVVR
ncbi:ATP-binding cassette domain-containing protein [Demequina sp. SYSU T00192]|uniref:ATP-binding cassette domain-containing protein n=1 Tax=Demequina litoralis TaxID=3051660 RepID=A0ABT8GA33_9MICO|nr:ATP-binding cassette domain-containing protein [Demequina sp. SYSU T00192]MDN4475981.1 ATP-binding cassette domain-containing protein [Demequina sp. SYSU T00192]